MRGSVLAIALALGLVAAPAWASGELVLQTHPPGAQVTLDGRRLGASPRRVELAAGEHEVQAHWPGHQAVKAVTRVVEGLTTRVRLALPESRAGELHVESAPAGARVTLDGLRVGGTPLLVRNVKPGRHRVVVSLAGYAARARVVDVPAGLTRSVSFTLPAARPARPPSAATPRPEPTPAATAAPPEATPAPEAPAPPAQVPVATGEQPASARPSPHEALFLALMAALATGLVFYLRRRPQPARVHVAPARPARGVLAEGAPEAATAHALGREHWAEAVGLLWEALREGRGTAWHDYHLGLALERLERDAEAEAAYRTALAAEPAHAAAGYNLAALLARTGQLPQAIIQYRRHLEGHPADVDALYNLGALYLALGMNRQALVHWTAARRLAPKDGELLAACRFIRKVARTGVRRAG